MPVRVWVGNHVQADVPSVRSAASTHDCCRQSSQGFKLVKVLHAEPPLQAFVGHGPPMYDKTGALQTIRSSLAEVPLRGALKARTDEDDFIHATEQPRVIAFFSR